VQRTGPIIVELKTNVNIILIISSYQIGSYQTTLVPEKESARILFPIPVQKMSSHTYVIWVAYHSTLRLGQWEHAENFIFLSLRS